MAQAVLPGPRERAASHLKPDRTQTPTAPSFPSPSLRKLKESFMIKVSDKGACLRGGKFDFNATRESAGAALGIAQRILKNHNVSDDAAKMSIDTIRACGI